VADGAASLWTGDFPLRSEFKGRIKSVVHDQSSSGATLFVEPLPVVELNNAIRELELAERDEERRVLAALSAQVGEHAQDLIYGIESLALLDLTFAKAKYAEELRGCEPILHEMLETKDAYWRGLGLIPKSGLKLKKKFAEYDAEVKYGLCIESGSENLPGCRCGEVLQGKISPPECPLFAKTCHPDSPYGPCMVSFEGACLAFYKYARR